TSSNGLLNPAPTLSITRSSKSSGFVPVMDVASSTESFLRVSSSAGECPAPTPCPGTAPRTPRWHWPVQPQLWPFSQVSPPACRLRRYPLKAP
ncbi:hypothetical protein THAOC_27442, partial [Thalassiosira oceanica]